MITLNKNRNNKLIKLFIIFLLIGLVLGFLYYINLDKEKTNELINILINKNNLYKPNNNAIDHLKILSVVFSFSLIYIGIIILLGHILSISFINVIKFILFYKKYKIKGTLFYLIYFILNEGIYIFLLYYFYKKIIKIIKNIYIIKKKGDTNKLSILFNDIFRVIFLIIIIFIIDFISYNILSKTIKLFAFLLK